MGVPSAPKPETKGGTGSGLGVVAMGDGAGAGGVCGTFKGAMIGEAGPKRIHAPTPAAASRMGQGSTSVALHGVDDRGALPEERLEDARSVGAVAEAFLEPTVRAVKVRLDPRAFLGDLNDEASVELPLLRHAAEQETHRRQSPRMYRLPSRSW